MSVGWKPIEYKFILLGDSTVGKTSIFSRLAGKAFNHNTASTIGTNKVVIKFDDVEISKEDKIHQNFTITLFDTAGQERYRAITKTYFKDSQGIILIYSINNERTFQHVQIWLESIKESLSDWKRSGYIVMLLGNKLDIIEEDMEKREVLYEEAQRICLEQGIYWGGEYSAKTFDNDQIKEIFEKFMKLIYLKLQDDDNEKERQRKASISIVPHKKRKNNCCRPNL